MHLTVFSYLTKITKSQVNIKVEDKIIKVIGNGTVWLSSYVDGDLSELGIEERVNYAVLKEILDTYNDNNEYYKDQLNIPLAERIFDVLRFNYALPNICHTFKHKDILNIYSPYEILYNLYKWNMVRIANCMLTEEDFKLFENEFVPYKNQIQDKQNEINWLYGRIHELENSTSFKITKPLRKLGSFVRKVFRKLKKIAKKILRGG